MSADRVDDNIMIAIKVKSTKCFITILLSCVFLSPRHTFLIGFSFRTLASRGGAKSRSEVSVGAWTDR